MSTDLLDAWQSSCWRNGGQRRIDHGAGHSRALALRDPHRLSYEVMSSRHSLPPFGVFMAVFGVYFFVRELLAR